MDDFDLYDVLADLAYGMAARSRTDRAEAFSYKNGSWLSAMPTSAASTVQAIASQFARSGSDGLENPHIFNIPGGAHCWRPLSSQSPTQAFGRAA